VEIDEEGKTMDELEQQIKTLEASIAKAESGLQCMYHPLVFLRISHPN
jgi:hypothetical protein